MKFMTLYYYPGLSIGKYVHNNIIVVNIVMIHNKHMVWVVKFVRKYVSYSIVLSD